MSNPKSNAARNSSRNSRRKAQNSKKPESQSSTATKGVTGKYEDIRSNDISWYNKVEPLFSDAVRVPFNRIAGDPIQFSQSSIIPYSMGLNRRDESVPGIMAFNFVPTIGRAQSSNDPINRAFTTMYSDIYSRTTGAMQFQQADLAMWVVGMDSIITLIGAAKRLLGVANLYVAQNYTYPRVLLNAITDQAWTDEMFQEFVQNQDLYRRRLNNSILSFNSLNVPDFLDLFKRHYSLASNIWADSDAIQAQLYVFNPVGCYEYIDTELMLKFKSLASMNNGNSPLMMEPLLDEIEYMLELWRNSSDLGLIKGSVERAYQDSAFVRLEYVNVDTITIPTYDRIMMYQINNATLPFGNQLTRIRKGINNITQSPARNLLLCTPTISYSLADPRLADPVIEPQMEYFLKYSQADNWLEFLNSFDGQIDAEFIMEATRLKYTIEVPNIIDTTALNTQLHNVGTEFIDTYRIWNTNRNPSTGVQTILGFNPIDLIDVTKPSAAYTAIRGNDLLSKFNMAPRMKFFGFGNPESNVGGFLGEVGDLNVYTTIEHSALNGLNEAALQSIYTVQTQQYLK